MNLPRPAPPPYDIRAWQRLPHAERLRMVCQAWALQGYGTPWPIYLVYVLKLALYAGGWCFFCTFTPGLGDPRAIATWAALPVAFQKAVLWSMLFESLGLGCGSGPLTGRYLPPVAAPLHFLRPGTTKLPLIPGLPVLGGSERTWLDVALYTAHCALLVRALVAPAITPALLVPTLVVLPVLGLADRTVFLAARAEHYGTALVCFLFTGDWLSGCKILWVAVWLWAATSKLNRHFPSVVAVMQSNSPLTWGGVRRHLYRSYPDDLRPSTLARAMAHGGTVVELAFPVALLHGDGGTGTAVALGVMLAFHLFITTSIPMGVPLEWNVMMVYGGFFLFGAHAASPVLPIGSTVLLAYLGAACFLAQVAGNLFPARVSFLVSMRYYAGNWPYSVWLFRGDAARKLDAHLVKAAARVQDQLAVFYDEDTTTALLSRVVAFRAMHLAGRALQQLLPRAVDDIDAYEYMEGEIVAGLVLGWNFGDGHLHGPELLRAVQRQCGFAPGELRCVFVESQPLFRPFMAWTIADAATGILEAGEVDVRVLDALQPWPVPGPAATVDVAAQGP